MRHRAWTEEEVLRIRELYLEGHTQREIAVKFATTQKTISEIINLNTYADMGVPEKYKYRLRQRKKKR